MKITHTISNTLIITIFIQETHTMFRQKKTVMYTWMPTMFQTGFAQCTW